MQNSVVLNMQSGQTRYRYLCFIDWLLPIYLLLTMPLFYLGIDFGFVFKGLAIIYIMFYLIRFGFPNNKLAKLFTAFFLLVLFSFIQYIYNERPFSCFLGEASNYLLAMSFFYVGVTDDRAGRSFYKKLAYATAITFLIGLICYVLTPSWYVARVLDVINSTSVVEYNEYNVLDRMRFSAFWGDSYPVSHFSVFCIAIAIFDVIYDKGRDKSIALICLLVGLIASIASMHRASIAGSLIALGLYFYCNHRLHKTKNNIRLVLLMTTIVAVILIVSQDLGERIESIFGMITERVDDNMSLSKAYAERKNTNELISSMKFFVLGHGLGSGGILVRPYGFPGISDMQYIKMFFENGIVGAFLFIVLMLNILKIGIKYIRFYVTDLAIVMFILFAMIGSNSLSIYFLYVVPFWYAAGRICNNKYLQQLKTEGWK